MCGVRALDEWSRRARPDGRIINLEKRASTRSDDYIGKGIN